MDRIPGFIHFYKPVTIPALLDLFRDNLDDGITARRCEQLRLFFLRQCEKYSATRHIVLSPTIQVQRPGPRERPNATRARWPGSLQRIEGLGHSVASPQGHENKTSSNEQSCRRLRHANGPKLECIDGRELSAVARATKLDHF